MDFMPDLDKGLGVGAAKGWSLLKEEVSLPALVLYDRQMQQNLAWMQGFVDAYGLNLAPHGKTTMAPKLFLRQMAGGAWGITVATAHQARVAARHGIKRVLMANQLVGKANMAMVAELLRDPDFEFFCLADSVDQAAQLGAYFADHATLNLLLELAPTPDQGGHRAGVQTEAQAEAVLAEIRKWPALNLSGIEVYEGVLKDEAEIRAFLRRAVEMTNRTVFDRARPILSGAGSAWYDVVAEEFAKAEGAEVVLRPGCYLTHDVGIYKAAQGLIEQRNPVAAKMRGGLKPALHLWAYVQSIPESTRAIVAFGKRDAAFDAGFPEPARHFRPGSEAPTQAPTQWAITGMMDQHAYLTISEGDDIRVGDLIAFDISHPCLTFDKWRRILLVDEELTVIDLIETYF